MSIFDSILPNSPELVNIVTDNTLLAEIQRALLKPQLWRAEVTDVEPWPNNPQNGVASGVSMTFTREGEFAVTTEESQPGEDPTAQTTIPEQWHTKLQGWNRSTDVDVVADSIGQANQVVVKARMLADQSGAIMDRVNRDVLFRAYGTGHTVANNTSGATTTIEVPSVEGFTHQLNAVTGGLDPVSGTNRKLVIVAGAVPANDVRLIQATPVSADVPYGPGVLTFDGPLAVNANDAIMAADAPAIIYTGGGSTVDAIDSNDLLALEDIQVASALMVDNNIPKHMDGFFHCHLTSTMSTSFTTQLTNTRLMDGMGPDAWSENTVGVLAETRFIRNSNIPRRTNVGPLVAGRPDAAPQARIAVNLGLEMVNATGINLVYTIVTGGSAVSERPLNLFNDLTAQAGLGALGYNGAVGAFRPMPGGNGIVANTNGIKFLVGRPSGKLGDKFPMTWVAKTSFACPSDSRAGYYGSRLKRCVVIASADGTFRDVSVWNPPA